MYTNGIVAKTIFLVAVCKISHWLGVDDDVDHGGIGKTVVFIEDRKAYGKGAAFMIGVFRATSALLPLSSPKFQSYNRPLILWLIN